jgi:hypothetical protein
MALDKLVDSAALDDALDYTASRIRAKLGSSSLIPFDLEYGLGFGDAINAIGYSVDAVFNQGANKIFTTDDLDAVKPYLTVTVTYPDSSTEVLADDAYTLSGTLTAGNSIITVTALRVSTTISVTVTAAEDVTPSISSWIDGSGSYVSKNIADGAILVESASNGTYRNANVGITLEAGARYRFSADIDYFIGTAKLVISTSSWNWITNCSSPNLTASGKLIVDCKPSDANNFTTSAHLLLYCTTSASSGGKVVFRNVKVIKYAE